MSAWEVVGVLDAIERDRLAEALYLKALGYSCHEIGRLTGSSYSAVNRRITEGRRALRRASRDAQ